MRCEGRGYWPSVGDRVLSFCIAAWAGVPGAPAWHATRAMANEGLPKGDMACGEHVPSWAVRCGCGNRDAAADNIVAILGGAQPKIPSD